MVPKLMYRLEEQGKNSPSYQNVIEHLDFGKILVTASIFIPFILTQVFLLTDLGHI